MKKFIYVVLNLLLSGCATLSTVNPAPSPSANTLFLSSTLAAFLQGDYYGSIDIASLSKHGDFGLGTFDQLDGEMLALDGRFYQISASGKVKSAQPTMTSPYAALSFFKPTQKIEINKSMRCKELYSYLDSLRSKTTPMYAIKLSGSWSKLTTRSIAAQTEPYQPFEKVRSQQQVFNLENIKATLAGFWTPAYLTAISPPYYHFHALTDDHKAGGHVLDCQTQSLTIELSPINQLQIILPGNSEGLDSLKTE
jgi:acetolactate decarboxylase